VTSHTTPFNIFANLTSLSLPGMGLKPNIKTLVNSVKWSKNTNSLSTQNQTCSHHGQSTRKGATITDEDFLNYRRTEQVTWGEQPTPPPLQPLSLANLGTGKEKGNTDNGHNDAQFLNWNKTSIQSHPATDLGVNGSIWILPVLPI
jgi:hypothetical protein